MSEEGDLSKELVRIQAQQEQLLSQLVHAIRNYGSERAQMALAEAIKLKERAIETMVEAEAAIEDAVEIAVEDESVAVDKQISRLAKRAFPRSTKRV